MTMPIRRLGGAFSISLLAITLVACGGSTPTTAVTPEPAAQVTPPPPSVAPDASAPAGSSGVPGASLATTGRIEVVDKGFALTLPDGWTRVDLAQGDLDAMIEAAGNVDPALAAQYSAQIKAMLGAGLAVFAFGPDPASGTNLNVIALPGAGLSLDLLEQLNKSQIEAIAGNDVQVERVTLPAGEAVHYRYEITSTGLPAGTSIDQYLLLAGENQLVVTATNATEAEAQAIANSVEILD
jgi:hypothetical protein